MLTVRSSTALFLPAVALAGVLLAGCGDGGGAKSYDVTVNFSESVTQADIDAVDALLRGYDDDLDFLIMEIFPPIGRAQVETDAPDFCAAVESGLEGRDYVRDVRCDES